MLNFLSGLFVNYGLRLFIVLLYELKYFFLGFKGNNINILNNKLYSDNIPTPYLFLEKINLFLKKKKFKYFVDLGCGSGRIIYFLNKKHPNNKIIGFELNKEIFIKTCKLFRNHKNIRILNKSLFDFKKYHKNNNSIIYFLNDSLKLKKNYKKLFKQLFKKIKKKGCVITINLNYNIKLTKKVKLVQTYMIKNKNYKIYEINK